MREETLQVSVCVWGGGRRTVVLKAEGKLLNYR